MNDSQPVMEAVRQPKMASVHSNHPRRSVCDEDLKELSDTYCESENSNDCLDWSGVLCRAIVQHNLLPRKMKTYHYDIVIDIVNRVSVKALQRY